MTHRYASIDTGTNTLRLLIADADASGRIRPVVYKRIITRLGGGYTDEAGIGGEAAERTFAALAGFRKEIIEARVDEVLATATSVVRRARNREWFIEEVRKKTGIALSVISGDEEARLALSGVLSVMEETRGRGLVIDIGGGSTEFILTENDGLCAAWSMEMGVVHLTERHLLSDPPAKAEAARLEAEIDSVIAELLARMKTSGADASGCSAKAGCVFIGTAGTITTLAALDMDLSVYDRGRINNYRLSRRSIARMYERLLGMTLAERGRILSLEKGREDLIIPGAAITLRAMETFGFDEIIVSDAGLLEGIIIDRVGQTSKRSAATEV